MRSGLMSQRNSVRTFPFPGPWENIGKSWCIWCGERIIIPDGKRNAGTPNMRAQWHPECVHDHNLHTRLDVQYRHVKERDGERCAWLDCGAAPFRWYSPKIDTVYSECPSMPWKGRRDGAKYWDQLLEWGKLHRVHFTYWEIDWRCALELDHRRPLWSVAHLPDEERRPFFGPDNLWLLCPAHHKAKTKREAAQRAHERRLALAQPRLI
jgi:hypothetical protein